MVVQNDEDTGAAQGLDHGCIDVQGVHAYVIQAKERLASLARPSCVPGMLRRGLPTVKLRIGGDKLGGD